LCTTFVREKTPFTMGIKRLQFKDHRNMSTGDDMLGFNLNPVTGKLTVLKAESKSNATMPAATVAKAREALSGYSELPSPHSMGSLQTGWWTLLTSPARRNRRRSVEEVAAQRCHAHVIRIHGQRHDHAAVQLERLHRGATQHYVGLRVTEHQKFIKAVFTAVGLMASTLEELRSNISEAVEAGYRQQLLARAGPRHDRRGRTANRCAGFQPTLSEDLLSFGYSPLLHGLRHLDLGGDFATARQAFEVAAESIEAVVARGAPDETRGFHRLVAGSAYHLDGSLRAYSLLRSDFEQANLSVVERCLAQLVLRDLVG
jgi:hypothetical protein